MMIALAAVLMMAGLQQTDVEQIAPGRRPGGVGAPGQIGDSAAGRAPVGQITAPGRAVQGPQQAPSDNRAPQQLNVQQGGSAAPAGPGRSDRSVAVAKVGGSDICDQETHQGDEACRNAIEKRADEFTPPAPETVLLSSMRSALGDATPSSTARQLQNGDLENDVARSIADLANRPLKPDDRNPKGPQSALPSNVQDAVTYTLQVLGSGAGR